MALAFAAAALHAADVGYAARVDTDNKVWVDVSNATRLTVKVTSMTVVFYDKGESVLERRTLDCERECTVSPDRTESFGPIEGPRDWDSVKVSKVLYQDVDERETEPRPTPPAPRPPRAPAAVDSSSPEAVLRALYVALNRGDLARAGALYPRLGGDDVAAWAKAETRDATVTDVKLLERVSETAPSVRAEISFADGSKTRRRVVFKRAGAGWKLERLEPAS